MAADGTTVSVKERVAHTVSTTTVYHEPVPLMRAFQLRDAIARLGITQQELAWCLCVDDKTVRRWVSAKTAIPGPVDRAVRAWSLLQAHGVDWVPRVLEEKDGR